MNTLGKCDQCETELRPAVHRNPTGFYIGFICTCEASNERFSDYYETYQIAEEHRIKGTYKLTEGNKNANNATI